MIPFTCPSCNSTHDFDDGMAGRKIACVADGCDYVGKLPAIKDVVPLVDMKASQIRAHGELENSKHRFGIGRRGDAALFTMQPTSFIGNLIFGIRSSDLSLPDLYDCIVEELRLNGQEFHVTRPKYRERSAGGRGIRCTTLIGRKSYSICDIFIINGLR